MGSAPQTPQAPDPYQTAIAQGAANVDTAQTQNVLNNTNQVTPYGTVTYNDQTGQGRFVPMLGGGQQWIPRTVATTTLSPEMQQLFNQNVANSQTASNTAGALGHNVQNMLSNNVDLGPSSIESYLNRLNTQTLDPQWQHNQTALDQQLANQGLPPGSEGWKYAGTQFGLNKANAYNNMYLQGHNTAVQDILSQYNEPLNALSALQSGSQVSQPGVGGQGGLGADNQEAIRGAYLDNVVLDEFPDMSPSLWGSIVRPMRADSGYGYVYWHAKREEFILGYPLPCPAES
jgi:hypothetical protein